MAVCSFHKKCVHLCVILERNQHVVDYAEKPYDITLIILFHFMKIASN